MNSAALDARFACEDLLHRSYQLVDDGNASQVSNLFTADGRFVVQGSVDVTGEADLATLFAARESDTQRQTRHCLTNVRVSSESESTIEISATLMLFVLDSAHPTVPAALAEVQDRHQLVKGEWRIASRVTRPIASAA